MKTNFFSILFLILLSRGNGCSPIWPEGEFIEYLRATSNPNELVAIVGTRKNTWKPESTTLATIDLTTGRVTPAPPEGTILDPVEPSDPNTDYELVVSPPEATPPLMVPVDPSDPNTEYQIVVNDQTVATLTGPNGLSTSFDLTLTNDQSMDGINSDFFVSEKLGKAYVFYGAGYGDAAVAIVDVFDGTVSYTLLDFYFMGKINAYYDDLQVVSLEGAGSDCISNFQVFYTESTVEVRKLDTNLYDATFLDAVAYGDDVTEHSAYLFADRRADDKKSSIAGYVLQKMIISSGETMETILYTEP